MLAVGSAEEEKLEVDLGAPDRGPVPTSDP